MSAYTLRTAASGQFVLRFTAQDSKGQPINGAATVWVCGADFDGMLWRMNDLAILTDKRTYAPGETAHVLVQSDQPGAHGQPKGVTHFRVVPGGGEPAGRDPFEGPALDVGGVERVDHDDHDREEEEQEQQRREGAKGDAAEATGTDHSASKAEVLTRRLFELNRDLRTHALDGDIESTIGLGLVRRMDMVFSCLDNRLARREVNLMCQKVAKPWVDGSMENLLGDVTVFLPDEGPCYQCTLNALDDRTLDDIGFVRGDIEWVSDELASRSLHGGHAHAA